MSESSIRNADMTPTRPKAANNNVLNRAGSTGTVEHHSANAKAMATSSPEPQVAE
jgi:hypothetical protein